MYRALIGLIRRLVVATKSVATDMGSGAPVDLLVVLGLGENLAEEFRYVVFVWLRHWATLSTGGHRDAPRCIVDASDRAHVADILRAIEPDAKSPQGRQPAAL